MIDENLIHRFALLSSIEFPPEERASLRDDLREIVSYVERLGELDLEGTATPGSVTRAGNVLQPDVSRPGLSREAAFQNAPEAHGPFFKAPPIIER